MNPHKPCANQLQDPLGSWFQGELSARTIPVALFILICWAFMLSLLAVSGRAGASPATGLSTDAAIEQKWGIQIIGIRQSAAGHMLDFRYRVVDATKATPLFVRHIRPYLVDQKSGKSLVVPNMAKVGPLRSSDTAQKGRTYWMFFGNPGVVKAGDRVSVVIGEFRVKNLTVR